VDRKLVVTLCQAEEVGNNKNVFLHHELNPSCSALITHSLTQQIQLVCVQTSAKIELRSHNRKAVTIHQLAGPVMKCNFCGQKFLTFSKMVVIKRVLRKKNFMSSSSITSVQFISTVRNIIFIWMHCTLDLFSNNVSVPEQMNIKMMQNQRKLIWIRYLLKISLRVHSFLAGLYSPQYYSLKFFSLITGIYLEKTITNLKQVWLALLGLSVAVWWMSLSNTVLELFYQLLVAQPLQR
jgi:hypothetical protein